MKTNSVNMKGGKNMKSNKRKTIIIIVLLLLVGVSIRYVAGTYAKYTSSVNASGTATVAKWAFDTDNASSALTINLTSTVDATSLTSGKIAPGTSGTFVIAVDNTTSEVGVQYTVSFGSAQNVPQNLVFTYNNTTFNPTANTIQGYLPVGQTDSLTIDWEWPYETGSGAQLVTEDGQDTSDGSAANTMTITATIVGVQTNPGTTVTKTASVVANP